MEKKKIAPPEKFFKQCVGVWFKVYEELVPPIEVEPGVFEKAVPSFIGAETRHMKSILKDLRERAERKNVIWTEEEAKKRFELFIRRSWEDDFVSRNFMLRIISNNRTKIFNNQISQKNGTGKEGAGGYKGFTGGQKPFSTSDSKISALAKWGVKTSKGNQ